MGSMLDHIYNDKYFNWTKFENIVKKKHGEYKNATPFPHTSLDDLFTSEVLDDVLDCFPPIESDEWDRRNDIGVQVKLRTKWKDERDIPPKVLRVIQILQSGRFVRLLSEYTGIDGLMPDYWYGGGGLNQILPGGELAVHVDGTLNDEIKMYRRVNLIVFLNKDWEEEYGGHLEFWDSKKKGCVKKLTPSFNKIAIFNTSDLTYHGHPYPLTCPEERSRKSLILYYYTATRPESEIKFGKQHRALFSTREELGI
tara:strand:+ start:233 stop:994 length:762 start_codon:yes stop_codon:yes gene_type:complete